jgi:hypothetical protein
MAQSGSQKRLLDTSASRHEPDLRFTFLGPSMAVRWRGEFLVRDEEPPASQPPVARHQILHALSCPSTSTLRWDALPREPFRDLAIVVANLSYCCSDEGRIDVGIFVCELPDRSCAAA